MKFKIPYTRTTLHYTYTQYETNKKMNKLGQKKLLTINEGLFITCGHVY